MKTIMENMFVVIRPNKKRIPIYNMEYVYLIFEQSDPHNRYRYTLQKCQLINEKIY